MSKAGRVGFQAFSHVESALEKEEWNAFEDKNNHIKWAGR